MWSLAETLFPICRSITGDGVRETLRILSKHIPMNVKEVPTGTKAFDWVVPKEWNIRDAYIIGPGDKKICDFKKSNLHVVGYSTPIDKIISLDELQKHLYSLPDQPDAIPYVTSYYEERWGFCITHKDRMKLKNGEYHIFIDSNLEVGSLTYGEYIIPGETKKEIFLSTYVCHPSMANNELSGPVVIAFIGKWLASQSRRYTYRIVFIPETIGSIVYLSKNLDIMKENIIAGYNITCIGDDRSYSYLPSKSGNTLSDVVAKHVLTYMAPDYISYSFLDRASDERQYCSPLIDLPIASIMRSKYHCYPEYHTSFDNLDLITPSGLLGGYNVLQKAIEVIENNKIIKSKVYGEPQLGKRGLYPNLSLKSNQTDSLKNMMNLIAYADGEKDLLEIAEIIKVPAWSLFDMVRALKDNNILE